MSLTLISSPLQGFTDFRFRNAFNKHLGGIDCFYAPYIRLSGTREIKASYKRDILPENNAALTVIPQVMCKDADDMLLVAEFVQQMGYRELNWNLGCPYPMVSKKGMGAGLIKEKEKIVKILEAVLAKSDIELSIKMRLGNDSPEEGEQLLPLLNEFPIKHIIIHPRLGVQQYKGQVDIVAFERCLQLSKHPIIYNGDINSVATYRKLQVRFPDMQTWVLGRGIISDPFLPSMIKSNSLEYPANANEIFSKFHDTLMHENSLALSGDKHLLLKMSAYWEYFAQLFTNAHKCHKKIKKAQSLRAYETAVNEIIRGEQIVGAKD